MLVCPEIATNTGAVIRLCANTGAHLHLVRPLGFSMDDRLLRRAGLDYHELAEVTIHDDLDALMSAVSGQRRIAFSSFGTVPYHEIAFEPDDVLVFGAERSGLSDPQLDRLTADMMATIPMTAANRSLNLSNAVAVVVYEAWRQQGFPGSAPKPAARPGHGMTAETLTEGPFDS